MKLSRIAKAGVLISIAAIGAGVTTVMHAQQANMTFFVTSVGKGSGADLGGIAGADAHCLALAMAAGSTQTRAGAHT